jgi:[ribosomal protein S18]-alanine N-acetyltransferase
VEGLTIRPIDPADAAALERIMAQSPEAAEWPVESYGGYPGWVAETEGEVAGFLVAHIAADELEILNLAVEPARRRRGIGSRLLDQALVFGRQSGARRAFLEVRESNNAAREFYASRGFAAIARRRGYYRQPVEDALLMARGLTPPKQDPEQ